MSFFLAWRLLFTAFDFTFFDLKIEKREREREKETKNENGDERREKKRISLYPVVFRCRILFSVALIVYRFCFYIFRFKERKEE